MTSSPTATPTYSATATATRPKPACAGDGWFDIIDGLCAEITRQVKAGTMPPVVATQVKEKAGYLRFYIRDHFNRDANPQAHRLIELAQQQAEHTCQQCGRPVELADAPRGAAICPACARVNGSGASSRHWAESPSPQSAPSLGD